MKKLPILLLLTSVATGAPVEFNRDIRPILAEACFHCHGPDPGSRKASLRLDTEAGFFTARDAKDGTPSTAPVVKGKPESSSLYQRLITQDSDEQMPPKKEHKELKPAQTALIKSWIQEGASWQPHWSFIKPERAKLPDVQTASWVRNPIDNFVLARLEKEGLAPAPEADRHSLARRLSLDLTGLPPEPAMVASFASDTSPDAYEKLVDGLMKSDHWGEHRARYWLDAARYADTHGMHFDNYREMWPYRDWVISAFNANQPFDKFTLEQIAGDLLPSRTDSQLIATGFQRCNITTNEGGTIDDENLMLYAADRVQTLGWVYMGLTTNCSQCHDHKFDPITQRDYYSLAAFFRNTTQPPKDGNVKDSSPSLVIPSAADKPRWLALPADIAAATQRRDARKAAATQEFATWAATAKPADIDNDMPSKGSIVRVPLNEGKGDLVTGETAATGQTPAPTPYKSTGPLSWAPGGKLGPAPIMKPSATIDLGNLGDFERSQAFSYGAWIKAANATASGGIIARMDTQQGHRGWDLFQAGPNLAVHIVGTWPDDAIRVTTKKAVLRPNQWQHVFVTYNGKGAAGIQIFINGEAELIKIDTNNLKPASSIRTTTALRLGQRSNGEYFDGGSIQDFRLYSRPLGAAEVKTLFTAGPLRSLLTVPANKRPQPQRDALYAYYLSSRDARYQAEAKAIADFETERDAIKTRGAITHIQEEKMGSKATTNILMRGQYDKLGEVVEANAPGFLPPLPAGAPRNRLGLAQWLIAAENPLTARVTVNRFWQEIFGTGIVKTSEDFGIMGTTPSNQALLDWLAVEFREKGWDVKKFFKLLVTSAAYRQATTTTPEKIEKDRDNKLLSRGPRFRMDAEMLRDYALAASATLSSKMGGPGTRPYQPNNIWDQVGIGNTRDYLQDKGENLYRRTLYNFWKRMAPPPNLDIFNAPNREVTCVRRERTNTPLQALVTMNDPGFVEAARSLAQHAMQQAGGEPLKIVDAIAHAVLCRPLRANEVPIIQASFTDLQAHYKSHTSDASALLLVGESKADAKLDAAALAAWTMVCNEMLNLDEVLNK